MLALLAASLLAAPRAQDSIEFALDGERFVRIEHGTRRELLCTLDGGPGAVHAFDESPLGLVFVAAEHGLFVTSRAVQSLDPVDLWQGAPTGPAVGVIVDSNERLWLATRESFGCVELHQHFGRTFSAADGVPPPPYRSLARGAHGELVLANANGSWSYVPDSGSAPTVRVLAVDGVAVVPGATMRARSTDGFELAVEGSALGGAEYRRRDARHPIWYLLDGEHSNVRALEPGRHELVVTAWDRDLRRSPPVELVVDVPYPPLLEHKRLALVAAAAALAIAAAFFTRARRRGGRNAFRRAALSTIVAVVLAAQFVAALFPHARGWPFVGFGMYTDVAEPFSLAYRDVLVGIGRGGERFEIELWSAGFGQYVFRRMLVPSIFGGAAERDRLLDELDREHFHGELAGFEIRCDRQRLTAAGPIPVAPIEYVVHRPEARHVAR
ncbi:MAG: hypothetical protein K8S98_01465 [Planctomycetes bacterium]|nr:hypothetical protein [Planctomycetota bacterium]